MRITIGIISKESDGREVISVTFQGGTGGCIQYTGRTVDNGGQRVKCPYQPGWGEGMFV